MSSETLDLITLPRCTVTLTGATFDDAIGFDEWAALGKRIIRVTEAIQWVIGDWLNFGQARYLEAARDTKDAPIYRIKYAEALKSLGYAYASLTQYSWVARSVDCSIRIEQLLFRHHEVVAALESKQQKKFLILARDKGLTVAELRKLVRESEAADVKEIAPQWGEFSPVKQVTEWCLWWQKIEVDKMPKPAVESWLRELDRLDQANHDVRERLLARLGR